jgi:hypothetical protein
MTADRVKLQGRDKTLIGTKRNAEKDTNKVKQEGIRLVSKK